MQTQKVPAKKSFRVDELAKELGVKKFILKNWEKQFDLKKCGLDNKYSQEDFKIFAAIKNLVFIKKMPQSIAKKHLQEMLAGKEFTEPKQELQEVATQEFATQEISAQELLEQEDLVIQESKDQDAAKMICEQEQEIAEIATLEKAIQEMGVHTMAKQEITMQEMTAEEIAAEERAQAFIAKGLIDENETTYQGAHEDLQNEKIVKEIMETQTSTETSQVNFADISDTEISDSMLPEETINEEILTAQSNDIADIKPALQEKEAFIKNIQSFKEQLLKIHEQLK
ncbi:MAG: hypothetical protein V1646_04000 [bacterium]